MINHVGNTPPLAPDEVVQVEFVNGQTRIGRVDSFCWITNDPNDPEYAECAIRSYHYAGWEPAGPLKPVLHRTEYFADSSEAAAPGIEEFRSAYAAAVAGPGPMQFVPGEPARDYRKELWVEAYLKQAGRANSLVLPEVAAASALSHFDATFPEPVHAFR